MCEIEIPHEKTGRKLAKDSAKNIITRFFYDGRIK